MTVIRQAQQLTDDVAKAFLEAILARGSDTFRLPAGYHSFSFVDHPVTHIEVRCGATPVAFFRAGAGAYEDFELLRMSSSRLLEVMAFISNCQ